MRVPRARTSCLELDRAYFVHVESSCRNSYPMQSTSPARVNPYAQQDSSYNYDSKDASTTNLTSGMDSMSAFYGEVSLLLSTLHHLSYSPFKPGPCISIYRNRFLLFKMTCVHSMTMSAAFRTYTHAHLTTRMTPRLNGTPNNSMSLFKIQVHSAMS